MRSPNRRHDRESFFKYMSVSTAAIVLENCTLRWSSPLLFNDPFDVPRELSFGISLEDIVRASSDRMAKLIEHPPADTSNLQPQIRLIVDTVKRGISADLKTQLLAGLTDSAETHRPTGQSIEELREMWRSWLPQFRILCLTESPAHAAMWYHYADQYRGVALELRCDDELDSAWLGAKPVTYPAPKPAVYTADGWAELLTTVGGLAIESLLDVATYTKAPDWSYENEWRITSFMKAPETGLFTDYRFNPRELAGVYLGPKITPEDRQAILDLAARFPAASIHDVSIGMTREFHFSSYAARWKG
jgi:Protein of unknown function (DUF2971)